MRIMILLTILTASLAVAKDGPGFHNLSNDSHISGRRLTEKELRGKVIAVEEWGRNCPPCLASLPHIAKLAKKWEKDSRIVLIGSHCQDRNDPEIVALLKKNGCTYPVYQFFSVEGAPMAGGLPHAYVVNHKGETVWEGNPYSDLKGFSAAIETAVKAVPKPNPLSLLDGMTITQGACKSVANRLKIGQNAEPALAQLQSIVAKGGAAGEEAQAMIDRCNAWCAEKVESVEEALQAGLRSKAVSDGKELLRTFPSKGEPFKDELAAAAKDRVTTALAASRQKLDKLRQANAATANARKQLLSQVNLQLKQLATLAAEDAEADLADVKALWQAYADELKAQ